MTEHVVAAVGSVVLDHALAVYEGEECPAHAKAARDEVARLRRIEAAARLYAHEAAEFGHDEAEYKANERVLQRELGIIA